MPRLQADPKMVRLVQQLAPQSKLLRSWRLTGGMSVEMTAFEIERLTGQRAKMILRRPDGGDSQAAQNEFRLLQLTQSLGLPTPTPYHLDQSGKIFDTPCLVIEYIEGKMNLCPSNLADYLRQLAIHLAQIHSIDCAKHDFSFLPERAVKCAETLGPPPATLNEDFNERRIRAAMAAASPLSQRNVPVLLHGDFWPGNTLWQADRLTAVIDWEDAKLGDPLIDLAISRLDIGWIFGIDAMNTFTRHYQTYQATMPIDYADLPYWDLCAALRLIRMAGSNLAEWAAFFPPYGRADITEQTILADYNHFIAQAIEQLGSGIK